MLVSSADDVTLLAIIPSLNVRSDATKSLEGNLVELSA